MSYAPLRDYAAIGSRAAVGLGRATPTVTIVAHRACGAIVGVFAQPGLMPAQTLKGRCASKARFGAPTKK